MCADPAPGHWEQVDRHGRVVKGAEANGDPVDLLDAAASRRMLQQSAAILGQQQRRSADDFARDSEGRMVIREEDAPFPGTNICPLHFNRTTMRS